MRLTGPTSPVLVGKDLGKRLFDFALELLHGTFWHFLSALSPLGRNFEILMMMMIMMMMKIAVFFNVVSVLQGLTGPFMRLLRPQISAADLCDGTFMSEHVRGHAVSNYTSEETLRGACRTHRLAEATGAPGECFAFSLMPGQFMSDPLLSLVSACLPATRFYQAILLHC